MRTEKPSIILAADCAARLALQTPAEPPPSIVLDTNAVLDCWLFQDPRAEMLREALEQGHLRWRATPEMLAELAAVLVRPMAMRWNTQRECLLSHDLSCRAILTATPTNPADLRCTDPDDQKFLDLAMQLRAPWLVTRDRALLRLKRRSASQGVAILVPEHWPGR